MTASAEGLAKALGSAKRTGATSWKCLCPAHDDHNPSLSLTERNGTLLWHCHTGCPKEAVTAALRERGLIGRDDGGAPRQPPRPPRSKPQLHVVEAPRPDREEPPAPPPHGTAAPNGEAPQDRRGWPYEAPANWGTETERYMFRHADGSDWFWSVRFEKGDDKEFRFFLVAEDMWVGPNGGGKLPDPRPLFRLDELTATPDGWVLLVEGEKCANATVDELGGLATSVVGGWAGVGKADLEPLRGRAVTLWRDADDAGEKWQEKLLPKLAALGCTVRVLPVPDDVFQGWDVADAIADGLDIRALIDGAVAVPEPPSPLAFKITDWLSTTAYAGPVPEIRWLIENAVQLGVPGMLAASGDVGKSILILEIALRVVGGDSSPFPIFGGRVVGHGAVVILTAEDARDTVHRRLESLDPGMRRRGDPAAHPLYVIPLPSAGGPVPLICQTKEGVGTTPAYEAVREQLLAIPNLALVVIDPFQAFALADINSDQMAAQAACSALARLAAETGATVMTAHHVRKDNGQPPATVEEIRAAIRGVTGLVDGLRFALGMVPAPELEARAIMRQLGRRYRPRCVVRGAVVKSNEKADQSLRTMVRDDDTGLLVDFTSRITAAWSKEQLDALVENIKDAAQDGKPYTKSGDPGLFKRRAELDLALQTVSKHSLEAMADALLAERRIVQATVKGSRTQWFDVHGGHFAQGIGVLAAGAYRSGRAAPKGSANHSEYE